MIRRARAKYANGVLTPLEPLDLAEGEVVVLNIETPPAPPPDQETARQKFRVIPNHSSFFPGMDDPKKMKQLLADEDMERFLRVQEFGKGTSQSSP